jgi:hypothetical protein
LKGRFEVASLVCNPGRSSDDWNDLWNLRDEMYLDMKINR